MVASETCPSLPSVLSTLAEKGDKKIPLELIDCLKNAAKALERHEAHIQDPRVRAFPGDNMPTWAFNGYKRALSELVELVARGPRSRVIYPPWFNFYKQLSAYLQYMLDTIALQPLNFVDTSKTSFTLAYHLIEMENLL